MNITEMKKLLTEELNGEEARSIIELVTGLNQQRQILDYKYNLKENEEKEILSILKKRQGGYPLQYILGSWSFMGADYCVGEGVLIPRDDTEVVVRSVIPYLQKIEKPKILDLCSGSGIIPITLKRMFNDADVSALELSDKAIFYLEKNIERLAPEVKLLKGDLRELYGEFDNEEFDLIISNPPYIKKSDLSTLQIEVQSEPTLALDGGESGFDFYYDIVRLYTPKLKNGGVLAFELGEGQFATVKTLMENNSFVNIQGYKDFGNIYRAINGTVNI